MYSTQIKDITTITWHNLHFILEYYSTEILSQVGKIITEQEANSNDRRTLLEMKSEVIATVKTLKAMHTVIEHHRTITASTQMQKGARV
jgi:hypothetical protein